MFERIDHLRHVERGAVDAVRAPTRLHTGQIFSRQAGVIPQVRPEIVPVTGVQKVQVCLANLHIIGRGVRVKLLMPLRDERILDSRTMSLFDAVRSHDVQDAHANIVAVASSAR